MIEVELSSEQARALLHAARISQAIFEQELEAPSPVLAEAQRQLIQALHGAEAEV
jgi:hypothetical protein